MSQHFLLSPAAKTFSLAKVKLAPEAVTDHSTGPPVSLLKIRTLANHYNAKSTWYSASRDTCHLARDRQLMRGQSRWFELVVAEW